MNNKKKHPFGDDEEDDNEASLIPNVKLQMNSNISSEQKSKLLNTFKGDLNPSKEYSFQTKDEVSQSQIPIMDTEGQQQRKYSKMIIIGLIIALILVFVEVLTACLLIKNENEHPYVPDGNPYFLAQVQQSDFGVQQCFLIRNTDIKNLKGFAYETQNNKFVNNVSVSAQMSDFSSARIVIGDSQANNSYVVKDSFLSQNRNQKSLRFGSLGFSLGPTTLEKDQDPYVAPRFTMKLFDKKSGKEYLNTKDQNFFVMDHYLEYGFKLQSTRIFGFGERLTSFRLKDGQYTLYSNAANDNIVDNGEGGQQQQGHHPFIMAQLNDGSFFGVFAYNSNAQQLVLTTNQDKTTSLSLISIGGVLDIYFFIGPTFDAVLQQYHSVIGAPKLMPFWAHGFMLKSSFFTSNTNVLKTLDQFNSDMFPIGQVSFGNNALDTYQNMKFTLTLYDIAKAFPFYHFVAPYTHFIQSASLSPADIKSLLKNSYIGMTNDTSPLQVKLADQLGFCLDVFNPNIQNYLKQQFATLENAYVNGFWLIDNSPSYASTNATKDEQNPFDNLPFIPGPKAKADLSAGSVPVNMKHVISSPDLNPKKEFHFNLHSLYGTQMAMQLINVMSGVNKFVISDSTYPGAGQFGIAHVFPRNKASKQDLEFSVANMMNFGMFGIPNVGANTCGYSAGGDGASEEICVRYFQLAVISPLAIVNRNDQDTLTLFTDTNLKNNAKNSLFQRMASLIYMRTQLYKISLNGGSLIRPLIADYPNDTRINVDDVSSVLYGDSVKVEFQFEQAKTSKNAYFPGNTNDWLDFASMRIISSNEEGKFIIGTDPKKDLLGLYQRGNGTIIPFQNVMKNNQTVSQTSDMLLDNPISFSVFLDNSLNNKAEGSVLLDSDLDDQSKSQYFEVKADSGIMTFKQINNGTGNGKGNTKIEQIYITNAKQPVTLACVMYNDFYTVQSMNVQVVPSKDAFTQSILKPLDTLPLDINNIAFIFYGNLKGQACDNTLFNMNVTSVTYPTPQTAIVTISQTISKLFPMKAYDVYLNITQLTDNSIYFQYNFAKYRIDDTPSSVYDRNFSKFQNNPSIKIKLTDILVINNYPFYFQIKDSATPANILFSSQGQMSLFHTQITIFSTQYPLSEPDHFFGLGERTGQFFLQDKHAYTLFSNNQNIRPSTSSTGLIREYGTNGFYPIYYSKITGQDKITCSWTITSTGQDFIYNSNSQVKGGFPTITQVMPFVTLEQVLIFNLNPVDTAKALHNHIIFGELLTKDQKAIKLPPPEWAFGQFVSLNNVDNIDDVQKVIDTYKGSLNYPIEGFMLDMSNLDNFQSLSFNKTKFSVKDLQSKVQAINGSIFTIQKSGISVASNDIDYQVANSKGLLIKSSQSAFGVKNNLIGQDEQGDIVYLDHSIRGGSPLVIDLCIHQFQQIYEGRFGISLLRNEISNSYCSGNCSIDSSTNSLYKAGNSAIQKSYIGDNAGRAIGAEKNDHNLNGLMEAIQYTNSVSELNNALPILSASTAVGTGKLGPVGRILDQFDYTLKGVGLAVQNLQTLSLMGTAMVGIQSNFRRLEASDYSKDTFIGIIKLGMFSPLSSQQFFDKYQSDYAYGQSFMQNQQWRYMLMKYTRTQVFKQMNYGDPFIRPVFFDYPLGRGVFDITEKQFMYGPSLIVSITTNLYKEEPANFPAGTWCSVYTLGTSVDCFYQSMGGISNQPKAMAYLREGTITPMQRPFGGISKQVSNSFDLQNLNLDLHVMPSFNSSSLGANGNLLIEGDKSKKAYCYLNFAFTYFVNQKQSIAVTQQSQGDCSVFKGYTVGRVYIYNTNDIKRTFTHATINKGATVVQAQLSIQDIMFFDFSEIGIHISKVTIIDFY